MSGDEMAIGAVMAVLLLVGALTAVNALFNALAWWLL